MPLKAVQYQTFPRACWQEVFADIKDDDDDFEVVPVKPAKTNDDFSDGLWCSIFTILTVYEFFWILYLLLSWLI